MNDIDLITNITEITKVWGNNMKGRKERKKGKKGKRPLEAQRTVYICGFHTLLENMLLAYAG